MIFVTVGSMLPFDRLIEMIDGWATQNPGEEVFAQIGAGSYLPRKVAWARRVGFVEFQALVRKADITVAHAGMGSVITAREFGKPIVVVPRLASLREHTTNHQVHTAAWLQQKPGIFVAESSSQLSIAIAKARAAHRESTVLERVAPTEFTDRLRAYINS